MSNYSKTTDFEAKDSLPTGDSGKIIRGAEFETEFDAISTAIATKADTAGPTFTGTLTFETISDGTIGVTAFVDEDNMASDSATLVPTQQSVKAYVDSQVTAQDLDFQADSGGALSIDLDSEALTLTGGTGIDTSGSGNSVTFDIDSTVTTLTGTQTLTNKTLTTPTISGNLTTDGTIDGRDVATDGAKLDGIEAGATADQTASEIRTLVESATDSNVFTDADHSKLDGIEASATADQTDAEIRAAVEAATDSNVFTDADHSKLDGIEASADVTDTANVTAAGALMDSEVTNLAQVKAFDSSDYATAAQGTTADSALQNVVEDTTPQLGGDLASNGNDILFADNDKAIFGAGSDLQIYHHSGGNSIIAETGTGDLFVQATNIQLEDASGNNMIVANSGGAVNLYHNTGEKLATTSTGIDVTGSVVSDGLTLDNNGSVIFNAPQATDTVLIGTNDNDLVLRTDDGDIILKTNENKQQLKVSNNGDISFYEDTGTTAKLFWDASAEALGIGTSSPSDKLELFTTDTDSGINLVANNGNNQLSHSPKLKFNGEYQSNGPFIQGLNTGAVGYKALVFNTVRTDNDYTTLPAEAMRIGSSGKVSIGTTAASGLLNVYDSGTDNRLYLQHSGTGTTASDGLLVASILSNGYLWNYESGSLLFATNNTERMQIDSAGNVGIGSSTANHFSTAGTTNVLGVKSTSGGLISIAATGTNFSGIDLGTDSIRRGGVYSLNGSNLGFYTNATNSGTALAERMRIDSSGQVGIGVSSPSALLHVSASPEVVTRLTRSAGSNALVLVQDPTTTLPPYIGSYGNAMAFGRYGGGESMRIDSSGNVGIGTGSPSAPLHVDAAGMGDIYSGLIQNSTTDTDHYNVVRFMQGASGSATGYIGTGGSATSNVAFRNNFVVGTQTANSFVLTTNDTERMRIDASGNVLIGMTNDTPGLGDTDTGASFRADGASFVSRTLSDTSGSTFYVNRNTNDGNLIQFQKDGTTVGSIGTLSSKIYVGSGDTSLFFDSLRDALVPHDASTNAARGSAIDLGRDVVKFKDLYLSGNITMGSSAQINASNAFYLDSDIIHFRRNNETESARIDSSGNLLVGKSSSSFSTAGIEARSGGTLWATADGTNAASFNRKTSDGAIAYFSKDGTTVGSIGTYVSLPFIGKSDVNLLFDPAGPHMIPRGTNGGARDAAINLGSSSNRFKDIHLSGVIYGVQQTLTRDSAAPLELNRTTNDGELVYFKQAGIVRGSISISGSATSYNTSSDYRLKENVIAMSGATERLKQLAPKRFNFIADADTTVDGFLAHEVADVVPEAITGAKDAVDDDGNAVYQGIDQSKLVPLLVATIQELEARIAALESN
jgi:hypothetical protein